MDKSIGDLMIPLGQLQEEITVRNEEIGYLGSLCSITIAFLPGTLYDYDWSSTYSPPPHTHIVII